MKRAMPRNFRMRWISFVRQPCEHRLAGSGGMHGLLHAERARIGADGMPGLALQQRHDTIALQHGQMHGLAGGLVDVLDMRLRAARQIDLAQERLAKMQHAGAERIAAPTRQAGDIAPLDECRQQMVAGGNVQARRGSRVRSATDCRRRESVRPAESVRDRQTEHCHARRRVPRSTLARQLSPSHSPQVPSRPPRAISNPALCRWKVGSRRAAGTSIFLQS